LTSIDACWNSGNRPTLYKLRSSASLSSYEVPSKQREGVQRRPYSDAFKHLSVHLERLEVDTRRERWIEALEHRALAVSPLGLYEGAIPVQAVWRPTLDMG